MCLKAIFNQDYKDFEVIIVDNKSTDATVAKAKAFNVKIVNIEEYLPGRALNIGISHSQGKFLCFLSGHCIPVDNSWLTNLMRNFNDEQAAGVYGRQEPMSSTSDVDKRDLLNLFGLDKKIQIRDSFFHNANSMIKRDIWEKVPFDEKVTNIEDRVWAAQVLKRGYKIIYEPEASVYHYHGVHQNNNPKRCYNVVKILESLSPRENKLDIQNMNVVALIPVKGNIQYLNDRPLIEYTIERCKQSKYVKRTFISTDNSQLAELTKTLGAEAPFLRPKELSSEFVDLEKVLQFSLESIEKLGIFPDILVVLEVTYPFRKKGLIDSMIEQLIEKGLDSVVPVKPEYRSCWINKDNHISRIDDGFMPRSVKEPLYLGTVGLACITHPVFIREGRRLGDKVGFVEIDDPCSSLEVRNTNDLELVEKIIPGWWKKNS